MGLRQALLWLLIAGCSHSAAPSALPSQREPTAPTRERQRAAAARLTPDPSYTPGQIIGTLEPPMVLGSQRQVIVDLRPLGFLASEHPPPTVHPRPWRQAQRQAQHGLFALGEGVYQVRGYDLANMTLIRGNRGWIVVDPLGATEIAAAALDLVFEHLGEGAISAIVLSTSDPNTWAGVAGVLALKSAKAGMLPIFAPKGFAANTAQGILALEDRSRRLAALRLNELEASPFGRLGIESQVYRSHGTPSFAIPTRELDHGQKLIIDGLEFRIHHPPASGRDSTCLFEVPARRLVYLSDSLHRLLQGGAALTHGPSLDPRAQAEAIEAMAAELDERTDVVALSYQWPALGAQVAQDLLREASDLLRYVHDQSRRLARKGLAATEIIDSLDLPAGPKHLLDARGSKRGLRGLVRAALGSIYGGSATATHARLHGKRFSPDLLRYMGGYEAVVEKARKDFEAGRYAWVAAMMQAVLEVRPTTSQAIELLAAAYQQLAFQSDDLAARNTDLRRAQALRDRSFSKEVDDSRFAEPLSLYRSLPLEEFFSLFATRVDPSKLQGERYRFNLAVRDTGENYLMSFAEGIVRVRREDAAEDADATLSMLRQAYDDPYLGQAAIEARIDSGEASVEGDRTRLMHFLAALDGSREATVEGENAAVNQARQSTGAEEPPTPDSDTSTDAQTPENSDAASDDRTTPAESRRPAAAATSKQQPGP